MPAHEHDHSKEQEYVQQRYMQLQMIAGQINQIKEQMEYVTAKINEMEDLNQNLEQMKSWKKGKDILAPIGVNTFVRAELVENSEVIMEVGSKVMLAKTIDSARETNTSQINELREFSLQLTNEFSRLNEEHSSIEMELAEKIQALQNCEH
jgi:prefoldin alpha subunit